jgi:hypothetical protein
MRVESAKDWLSVLTERMDEQRSELERLRRYVNGDAPLPEMGRNTRKTWETFQKKARTNFGGIACQSHANRIRARGVRVGDDDQSELSKTARRIWRDNRLPMQIQDAVWDMLISRTGYLMVGVDADGLATITAEHPDCFYANPDPLKPWKSRAAVKTWRDAVLGTDHAMLLIPGTITEYERPAADESMRIETFSGDWEPVREYPSAARVWIFARRDAKGLIEPHTDLIDRILLDKLQRLSSAAIQAFKQRALRLKEGAVLPREDANGNPVKYDEIFAPAPGALWELPAGIDIWESGEINLSQLLEAEKADAREFAAVTGTPVPMLVPDAANQSAVGAAATTAQQVDACASDIDRIKVAIEHAIVTALTIEKYDLGGATVEVDFLNPAWVTLAEQMDAASKARATDMALPTVQKQILGWTQEQIDEDERNRRREATQTLIAGIGNSATPIGEVW